MTDFFHKQQEICQSLAEQITELESLGQLEGLTAEFQAMAEDNLLQQSSELTKQSSWWGSRLKARLPLIGIRGEDRDIVIKMLDNCVGIEEGLRNVENIITSSDINSISKGFFAAKRLGQGSVSSLISNFSSLLDSHNLFLKLQYAPTDVSEDLPNIMSPESPELPSETVLEEEEEVPDTEKLEELGFQPLDWDKISLIKLDKSSADLVLKKLFEAGKIDRNILETKKKLNYVFDIISHRKDESYSPELVAKWNELNQTYDALFSLARSILNVPEAERFLQLALPAVEFDMEEKQKYNLPDLLVEKKAHNALTRYLKRKWLEHKPRFLKDEDIDSIKIRAVDNIILGLKELDLLMNSLEKPTDSFPVDIVNQVLKLAKILSKAFIDLIGLAKQFNSYYRSKSKLERKDLSVLEIPRTEFSDMARLVHGLDILSQKTLHRINS